MKIICKLNHHKDIPESLSQHAFTQDEDDQLDITVGKEYDVFGIRQHAGHNFYLVLTDTENTKYPWWMPSNLYDVSDDRVPSTWTKMAHGPKSDDVITSSPAYHGNENLIEDGEVSNDVLQSIIEDSKISGSDPASKTGV